MIRVSAPVVTDRITGFLRELADVPQQVIDGLLSGRRRARGGS
jgi:hypothetical protein